MSEPPEPQLLTDAKLRAMAAYEPRRRNLAFESARGRADKIRAAETMAEFDECAAEFGMTFKEVYLWHKRLFPA